MAPRSARKRKAGEADAGASGRRKKREDTPMKVSGGGARDATNCSEPLSAMVGASASASPALPLSTPQPQTEEAQAAQPHGSEELPLSFDPEESQMMGTLDDSPSSDSPEDLFPMMLDTQYEEDEDNEEQDEKSIQVEDDMAYTGAEDCRDERAMNEEDNEEGAGVGEEHHDAQEEEEADQDASDSLIGASASIEEILQQLAEVASNFVTNFQELTLEGAAIEAELNQLNDEQDARCAKMLGRLERAGNSIFSFGGQPSTDDADTVDDVQATMEESQV